MPQVDETQPCEVGRRIKVRVIRMGYDSLSDFHRGYTQNGGDRSYAWWRSLSVRSSYAHIREAADSLGVEPSDLTTNSDGANINLMSRTRDTNEGAVPYQRVTLTEEA